METSSKIIRKLFSQIHNQQENIIFDTHSSKNITGIELSGNINKIQGYLQSMGFKKGDRVIIFLKDQIDFITILVATISLGGVVVIVEPGMGKKVLHEKILVSKPKIVFLEGILYDIFSYDITGILKRYIGKNIPETIYNFPEKVIVGGRSFFSKKEDTLKYMYKTNSETGKISIELNESDEALVIFTGGTTSNPKGVVHSHASLFRTIQEVQNIVGNYKVFYADLFHFALLGIASGSKVILGDENYSPKKVQKIFQRHHVECSFFAPYKLQKFIDYNIHFPHSLKTIITGSAPVYQSFLKRLYEHIGDNITVLCLYGMTEMLPISYINGKDKLSLQLSAGDNLGNILPSVKYQIQDGELLVSGKHGIKRYLGKEKHEFIQTGDIVENVGGDLVMKGRKKDMILRGNYNIYPGIYEGIMSSIPGVRECALFGIPENDVDEYIVLLIDTQKNYSVGDIIGLLQKGEYSIDSFAFPQYIFFGNIPKYGRQKKIQKRRLVEIYKPHVIGK